MSWGWKIAFAEMCNLCWERNEKNCRQKGGGHEEFKIEWSNCICLVGREVEALNSCVCVLAEIEGKALGGKCFMPQREAAVVPGQ